MGLKDMAGLGANALFQYMDFETSADAMKEKTAPMFKALPVAHPNLFTGTNQLKNWRKKIDAPKFAQSKEINMNTHSKMASLIYNAGHQHVGVSARTVKQAAIPFAKEFKEFLTTPTHALITGLATVAAGKALYDPIADKVKSEMTYPEMFEKFPELKNAEQAKVDDYWNIMREYSPTMTHNPIVAGQFIKNMLDFGMEGIDHPTLKSLVDIQESKNKAFSQAPMSMSDVVKLV